MTEVRHNLPAEELDADTLLEQFEAAWRSGAAPAVEDYSPPRATHQRALIEDLVKLDLEYRWRAGKRSLLEEYLGRFPTLAPLSEELIAEEYLVRHRWGDRPGHAEYLTRFAARLPKLGETLRRMDADLAAEFKRKEPRAPAMPASGPGSSLEILLAAPSAPVASVSDLLAALRTAGILEPAQLTEVERDLRRRFPELRALAKELMTRDWLTPYQVNQLLKGRAGELVLGPYLLLERLGDGATGWVFKARHRHLRRLVALKVLRQELLADRDVVARFYQEIRGVSRLSHPNVVHAYDAGPIGHMHVLIMEYAPGIDLGRLVRQSGPLPLEHACEYICQAALGLQHIHERGLVHRDVKPSNLLVSRVESRESRAKPMSSGSGPSTLDSGLIKILDLGLARLGKVVRGLAPGRPLKGGSSASLTPTGAVMMGTPDFLAPEQALDFHQADRRADIYSLGCTLFFLLTGQPPFPGGSVARKLLRHHQSEPPKVETFRPDVPTAVGAVLRRMLAKERDERFGSAAEVVDALSTALPGTLALRAARQPAVADAVAPWPSPLLAAEGKPWLDSSSVWEMAEPATPTDRPRRRGWLPWLVPAAVLLAVAGVSWLFWQLTGTFGRTAPGRSDSPPTVAAVPAIDFSRGFAGGRGLACFRAAGVKGARLRLINDSHQAIGTAFGERKVGIGRFTTEFTFQLPRLPEVIDGFTFTIQGVGPEACGSHGGGLGYGPDHTGGPAGIPRSVAIKFDLWDNEGEGLNSTGIYTDGAAPTIPAVKLDGTGINLHTDHVFEVRMTYDGVTLKVTITDRTTRATASQSYKVDIPRVVGGRSAYVGFTAGTGASNVTPDILTWTFTAE